MTSTTQIQIKQLRVKMGLTQRELARLLDISLKTIQNWEQSVSNPTNHNMIIIDFLLKNFDKFMIKKLDI